MVTTIIGSLLTAFLLVLAILFFVGVKRTGSVTRLFLGLSCVFFALVSAAITGI